MTDFSDRRAIEFSDLLRSMPDCGSDADFERIDEALPSAPFADDER